MYTIQQYAHTLYEVLEDTHPKDHQKVIDNFIAILTEHNNQELFPQVVQEIEELEQEKKDKKSVELTTARPLDAEEEAILMKTLNTYLGENIELKKAVDEGLISGLVIKVDDVVIDGSVKRRIENLKSRIVE